METQSVTPFWQDKKLYAMVLGVLLPFISKWVGIELDPEKVALFLIPIVTYIVTHGLKSGAVLVAEIKAKAITQVAKEAPKPPVTPEAAAVVVNNL